jgi:hypothetical protein
MLGGMKATNMLATRTNGVRAMLSGRNMRRSRLIKVASLSC